MWQVQELLTAMTESYLLKRRFTRPGARQVKFECGGCTGLIRFEYKKEVAYSTLQMNLLDASKKRGKNQLVGRFFDLLRGMELFEPLDDFDLQDLALLMKLEKYPANNIVLESGTVGSHFYVILAGEVTVVQEDNGVIAELGPGDIFGEMSRAGVPPLPFLLHCLHGDPVEVSPYLTGKCCGTRIPATR